MAAIAIVVRNHWHWLAIIPTAIIGIEFAIWVAQRADRQMREQLLTSAELIANSVNSGDVKALSFSLDDRANPAFLRMSGWMKRQVQVAKCRSVYSMVRKGNDIVFGPESLDVNDRLASPPGTRYQSPPDALLGIFRNPHPVTVGPYTDEYATFVSAFAPVVDQQTGTLLLVIGIDVEASTWNTTVATDAILPISLTALAILLLILVEAFSLLHIRDASLNESEQRYCALYENCIDGILMIDARGDILAANQAAEHMLRRPVGNLCSVGFSGIAGHDARVAEFTEKLSCKGHVRGELTLSCGDDTFFQAEARAKAFTDHRGEMRATLILRDISERQQWEKEREHLIAELTAARVDVKMPEGPGATAHEDVTD